MKLPNGPAILLLDLYPREQKTCPHKNMYMDIHGSVIHGGSKVENKNKKVDKKMWYAHNMKYYSSIKRNVVI